jgi:hypothetical protein
MAASIFRASILSVSGAVLTMTGSHPCQMMLAVIAP